MLFFQVLFWYLGYELLNRIQEILVNNKLQKYL